IVRGDRIPNRIRTAGENVSEPEICVPRTLVPAGEMPQQDQVRIRLFGAFEVRVGGEPMGRVRSRSVEWLLALLAMRLGCEVPRDWLAALLWPESAHAQALLNLRRNLMELRRALGPAADRLRSPARDSLLLDLTEAEVDLIAFDRAIGAGDDASLDRAVSL